MESLASYFWQSSLREFLSGKLLYCNSHVKNSKNWSWVPSRHVLVQNQQWKHKKYQIYSKLTMKTPERILWRRSGVFIVNFERISYLVLMFPSLTLNKHVATGKQVLLIITKSFGKNFNCGVWFRSSTLSIHSLKNVYVSSSFVVTFLSCH